MQDGRIAIGRRIKRLREIRGLSRQQIADRLRVDLTAAAAWEAGKYLPREGRRLRLAELLEIDVATLFAEAQVPSLGQAAALVDSLSEAPGILRELAGGAGKIVRTFRLYESFATRPFVLEEFRRIVDRRLLGDDLTVEHLEMICGLPRLKEVLANILRYRGRGYRVRVACHIANDAVPGMSGYLFDDVEILLAWHSGHNNDSGRPMLRLSGEPYRSYFVEYWRGIWPHTAALNPDGTADLKTLRDIAHQLGLPSAAWEGFLADAKALRLDDGLPPLI